MSTFCPQSELQNHYWLTPKTSWEKPQNHPEWMRERKNESIYAQFFDYTKTIIIIIITLITVTSLHILYGGVIIIGI